jgi:molecular chaperone GrpE
LENQGLKPIETENQEFNPYYHEALMKISSEQPENTIIEELQKGFLLNDKVIRPAKVKVSDGQK